jgi:hypothetical protein
MRFDWKSAAPDDMLRLIAAARAMAARHPHKHVRMFVFSLCKGLERFIEQQRRINAAQKEEESRVHGQAALLVADRGERSG